MVSPWCRTLLALSSLWACHAFVPSNQRSTGQSRTLSAEPKQLFSSIPFRRSSSRLFNVVDQFVAGRDEATRKKDTDQYLAEVQKRVDRINDLEATIEDLGDEELQAKTKEFKERLAKGEDINGPLLEEAFAVVREAAW